MTRVLLITGARSLADDPAAEAWARAKIAAALVGVDIGVIGDAREGVDQWAWDEAATPERPVRVYRTRGPNAGRIWIAGEREFARWTTEAPPSPKATHWEWARWLKSRNAAMVRDAAAMRDAGDDVRCLALLDGRKPAVVKPGEKRPTWAGPRARVPGGDGAVGSVITELCQRWRRRCARYRPAGEVVDVSRYEVALHPRHAPLKAFVEEHHYAGTWPATRFAFGLHDRGGELVGVAAYSVPVRDAVLRPLPLGADAVELGRLVLLDAVPGNAESFFVARCNDVLRREGLAGAVSFADPHPRTSVSGEVVKPGHLGVIYTALSAVYLGPARPHTLLLLPDGRSFNRRALSKIRRRERGWRYAVEQLVTAGAGEPWPNLDAWVEHVLATVIRREPHPGCLKYALPFDARTRRALPVSKPYPRVAVPVCAAVTARCA